MEIFDELKWRGLIKDISDEKKINNFFSKKGQIYIGFDPSFKSLHLGNYQTLCVLKRLQKAGHKVHALIGSITGLIGDPKQTEERKMQAKEQIEENVKLLSIQLKKLTGLEKIWSNIDFYKDMHVWDYLRDIGKMINVNYLLEKEVISRRLETGISYAEFSYTLLQGYDFLHLFEKENIICQSGGSDQWGNITTGLEMIRKTHGLETDACCFSIPLLLKPDGTKFGKSESGAVYLDANVTSPYVMYQFLINQPDSMIEDMLKRFTFLSKEEIEKTMKEHKEDVSKRIAQKKLGKELLIDIHSKEAYEKSLKISEALFSNKLDTLEKNDLFEALVGTNNITNINEKEINIVDLLIVANVVKSKTEARKLVEQKGIYVNNVLIDNSSIIINSKNSIDNKFSYIKKGKKDYYLIIWK